MTSKQKESNTQNIKEKTSEFSIEPKNKNDKTSSKQLLSANINIISNGLNEKKYFLKTDSSKKKKKSKKNKKYSTKTSRKKNLFEIINETSEITNKNKKSVNSSLFKYNSNPPNTKQSANNIENVNVHLSLIKEAEVPISSNHSIRSNNSKTDLNSKEKVNNSSNKNITITARNKKSSKFLLNATAEKFLTTKELFNGDNQNLSEKNKKLNKNYSTKKSQKKILKHESDKNSKESISSSSNEFSSMNGTDSKNNTYKNLMTHEQKNNISSVVNKLCNSVNTPTLKNSIIKNNSKDNEEIKTNNSSTNNINGENEKNLKKNKLSNSLNHHNSIQIDSSKKSNDTKNDNRKKSLNVTMRQKNEEELTQRSTHKTSKEKESHQNIQNLKTYYYLIFPGNASYLIKNCMCHRVNWEEPFSTVTSLYNFRWQQISYGFDYNSLSQFNSQIINHFENHYCISNKANMFINLMDYCEKRKISVFKYVPFTIIYKLRYKKNEINEENKNLENLKNFIENDSKYKKEYKDIGKYFGCKTFKIDHEKREEYQKNRINKLKEQMKKDSSNNNNNNNNSKKIMEEIPPLISDYKMYSDFFPDLEEIEKVPKYVKNSDDKYVKDTEKKPEINENLIGNSTSIEIPNTHYCNKNMWVVKALNLNRGMCIRIVNNFEQLKKIIEKFKEGVDYGFTEESIDEKINVKSPPANENNKQEEEKNNPAQKEKEKMYYCSKILIQKYIENPLLYKGRKCDMRIWVLLTQNMKVYVFKEGHFKACSVNFDINSTDAYTHITNYSFQKYNHNFAKFEKGNEIPFSDFQKFIDENYSNRHYNLKINLMQKIKEIVMLTMRSAKSKINKNNRNYQFELFGYDFMLDSDFNLYLIEINTNPGLEESSPWIRVIVPRMLDDALRLTIDSLFETGYDFSLNYKTEDKELETYLNDLIEDDEINIESKNKKNKKYISPFPVPGYTLEENMWDYVCDLNSDDPLDVFLDKKKDNKNVEHSYTGINYLLGKKNRRDKSSSKKLIKENLKKDTN